MSLTPSAKKRSGGGIFKEVLIKDRKIVEFEMFEPFKSILEGREPCRNKLLEELMPSESLGCASRPSDDRWKTVSEMFVEMMLKVYGFEK